MNTLTPPPVVQIRWQNGDPSTTVVLTGSMRLKDFYCKSWAYRRLLGEPIVGLPTAWSQDWAWIFLKDWAQKLGHQITCVDA